MIPVSLVGRAIRQAGVTMLSLFTVLTSAQTTNADPSVRWRSHSDPAGFTIEVPETWAVSLNQGRIMLQGSDGVRAFVWPTVVRNQKLDPGSSSEVLRRFANQAEPGFDWSVPRQNGRFAVTSSRTAQTAAVMSMSWVVGDMGTTAIVYFATAPTKRYDALRPTLAHVFSSFDSKTGGPNAAATSPGLGPLPFVTWTDPLEQAFSINVPKGWEVFGGQHSITATDSRAEVMMIADSSAIALQFGQTQFGSFIEPVRTAYGGIQSGYYPLGDGTQLFVSRYLPGEQFGKFYLERVPQRCTNVRITGSRPRPDLLPRFLQVVQRAGMQLGPQVDLGEVGFSCTSGTQSLVGSYVAATTLVATNSSRSGMGGAIWTPAYFSGYLTVPEMASEAAKISEAVLGSLSINARWMQQRNAAAQAAVMQDTLRSQQLQAQVLSQIAKTQREVSDTITQGYWQRSRVYDEISRKRENAILGTVDVVNPATGARFKLENSSNFYWMNDQGYKAGTLTHTSPGAGWTEMLVLP